MAQGSENIRNGVTIVAAAGTPVPLVTGGARPTARVLIRARAGNTGAVTVGGIDTFTHAGGQGIALAATDRPIWLGPCNLADIRVDAATSGDGVQWLSEE